MLQRLLLKIGLVLAAAVASAPVLDWAASRDRQGPEERESALRVGTPVPAPRPRLAAVKADPLGHFATTAFLNGHRLTVLVDTGATSIALRYEDASQLGLVTPSLRFDAPVSTANGVVRAARVVVREVRIGDVRVRDVEALVVPARALATNLLGMSFMKRLNRVELKGDRLLLVQ